MQDVLIDEKNGKIVDWKNHKQDTLQLADIYFRLEKIERALNVHRCGNLLEFKVFDDGIKKLSHANFCKVRLCPMCAWRRSLKIFGQVSQIMDYLELNEDYRYIFVTLTARNVSGDALSNELDVYFKSFNVLSKRKEFKAMSKGYFRCLEVTHNFDRNDYHPHFHMIIAVKKSYFKDSSIYLSHSKWVKLWQSCMGLDYEPFVDVRTVKPKSDNLKSCEKNTKNYSKVVAEIAKYAVKVSDYLLSEDELFAGVDETATDRVVDVLDFALHNRRLFAFGGKFRVVHKLLNLDAPEDGNLINTDNDDELRPDVAYVMEKYRWMSGFGNYVRIKE